MVPSTAKLYAVRSLNHVRNLSLLIPGMICQVPATWFGSIQDTAINSTTAAMSSMASLSLSQVVLQVTDSCLDVFGQTLRVAGVTEKNMVRRKLLMMHSLARNIRMMGKEKKRKEVETKMQDLSLFGLAFVMVIAVRFIKQTMLFIIRNLTGILKKLKCWIFSNKMELALTMLLAMNVVLLLTRI